ncbi:MAG: LemA family protein [Cryomorphaceae bacterium]|nr:LemA family protein [Cryomorphaceae bacterium]
MKYLSIIIPVGIIALLLLFGVSSYNGIITKSENATSAWADVESSYQRRFDLIPNLVETVKGYADFEKSTLIAVTEARAAAMGAMRKAGESGDVGEFQQANQNLGVAMGRFFGYTEQYPDLKANQNFMDLQSQLEGTENRINVARDRFNDAVKEYNAKIKRFPGNLFGFEAKNYFEAQEGSEQAPKVDFSN